MDNETFSRISGNIKSSSPLALVFYLLLRDYLPSGTLEAVVSEVEERKNIMNNFTNGWTGQHAINLADRILSL